MTNLSWPLALEQLQHSDQACVLVTIFSTKGSTPRATGSKMLVTQQQSMFSIGGGHLEHQAIKLSRAMLTEANTQAFIKNFSLGASLGQCCGGRVELLFEAFYPQNRQIAIFGAGHIAKALVPILEQLPCSIVWADSRADLFPEQHTRHTRRVICEDLNQVIEDLKINCHVLIMTHNHQLDQQLCETLLKRSHQGFIGVIGSTTKWKKFKLRLLNKGYTPQQVAAICCPIGMAEIKGKLPMEVAVSVSAQFIQMYLTTIATAVTSNCNTANQNLKLLY